jgi:hypothetical protein
VQDSVTNNSGCRLVKHIASKNTLWRFQAFHVAAKKRAFLTPRRGGEAMIKGLNPLSRFPAAFSELCSEAACRENNKGFCAPF